MSCVNQETGQEEKEKRFYKIDLGSRTKWISKRSPYPQKKLTPTSYVSSHLHANDAAYYSAAGVFAYRITPSKTTPLEVLVGIEDQYDKKSKKPLPDRINFLGGKREEEVRVYVLNLSLSVHLPRHQHIRLLQKDMSATNTAVREFWEESGGILPSPSRARISASIEAVLWYRPGKYALFIHQLDPKEHDLPKRYDELDSKRKAELAEMKKLVWMPIRVDSSTSSLVFDKTAVGYTPHTLLRGIFETPEIVRYVQNSILHSNCTDEDVKDEEIVDNDLVRSLIGSLSLDV